MHLLVRLIFVVALIPIVFSTVEAGHHGPFHKDPAPPITPPLLTADTPPPPLPPIIQMHPDWPGYGLPDVPPPPLRPECAPIGAVAFGGLGHHYHRGQKKDCLPKPACQPNGGCGPMNGPGSMMAGPFDRPMQLHPDWPGYTFPPNELCLPPGCCPPRQYPPDLPHYPFCQECHWMWPNPEGWCRKVFGTSDDRPPFAPWVEMPCGTTDCDFLAPAAPLVRRYAVAADAVFLFRDDADFAIFADAFDAVFTDSNGLDAGPAPRLQVMLPATKVCDVEAIYFGTDAWKAQSNFDLPGGDTGSLAFDSQLHSGELNVRYNARPWLTFLHGFRYIEFDEDLNYRLPLAGFPSTFRFETDNMLYGYQLGVDVGLVSIADRFQIVAVTKGGVYGNRADWQQVSNVGGVFADISNQFGEFASTAEVEVTGIVRLSEHCALRGGYQALWINGLAFALENLVAPDSADLLFMHGGFAGLELRF